MALKLENVIPVGRRMVEYQGMFNLTDKELKNYNIIDCGGGPSSFNLEANKAGASVTSIDPLYAFSASQISGRIDETFDPMMDQVKKNQHMFVWNHIKTYDELYDYRKTAIEYFIDDYEIGRNQSRYQHQTLPKTPFDNESYNLALCSHLLFLYSEQLDYDFHYKSLKEMIRIAKEVRVFPLIDLNGNLSEHLYPVMEQLMGDGYHVELVSVEYEFLKGANQCLRITKQEKMD